MSPLPPISSSLKSCGVTSSSNQLSSAMVPFRNSVRSAWFFHFQNFFIGVFLLSRLCICKSARIPQREHIAIDKVQISAFLGRDAVHVLQFPDVIGTHPAVLPCGGVAGHPAGIIAPEQPLHIELGKITLLFLRGKQYPLNGLFPSNYPGLYRVFYQTD